VLFDRLAHHRENAAIEGDSHRSNEALTSSELNAAARAATPQRGEEGMARRAGARCLHVTDQGTARFGQST
jgi:hypothetical protein